MVLNLNNVQIHSWIMVLNLNNVQIHSWIMVLNLNNMQILRLFYVLNLSDCADTLDPIYTGLVTMVQILYLLEICCRG